MQADYEAHANVSWHKETSSSATLLQLNLQPAATLHHTFANLHASTQYLPLLTTMNTNCPSVSFAVAIRLVTTRPTYSPLLASFLRYLSLPHCLFSTPEPRSTTSYP